MEITQDIQDRISHLKFPAPKKAVVNALNGLKEAGTDAKDWAIQLPEKTYNGASEVFDELKKIGEDIKEKM